MKAFSIAAVVATNLFIGVRYCWLIRKGRISPSLAMWVFFTIAVVGSLLTYLAEGGFGLWDNILNTADVVLVSTVSLAILLYGDKSTRFNRFDLGCLAAGGRILGGRGGRREDGAADTAIQERLGIDDLPGSKRGGGSERKKEGFAAGGGALGGEDR